MRSRKSVLFVAICGIALGACRAPGPSSQASSRPKLVVVLAIDQLRADRLDATLPGGLGRLVREGRVFTRAALGHGITETCPGHVALATGRHPGPAGVSGNESLDPKTGRPSYCVADSPELSAVLDDGSLGRSPARIRATTLGDWLKRADPRSRVYSISGKDRSAIAMGGRAPDGVYWFSRRSPGFTSSRYYMQAVPAWVSEFNRELAGSVPESWVHGDVGPTPRVDDYPAESPRMSRVSGHQIRVDDPGLAADQLSRSPFLDVSMLDFALELARRESLGERGSDLLWLGLSASDSIGHLYGPESHESIDALRRLDRALGEFLVAMEQRAGSDGLVVALSSDHGVLPLPEWLTETQRATCPVSPGRIPLQPILARAIGALDTRFGKAPEGLRWIQLAGAQLAVDREVAASLGVSISEAVGTLRKTLAETPGVARIWTPQEITTEQNKWAELYRRSVDPMRPPDLVVQVAEGCLLTPYPDGTTHGSPYEYDRNVPLVFWGSGIEAGSDPQRAETVDLAPTLAGLLGVMPQSQLDQSGSAGSSDLDGRDLFAPRPHAAPAP